MPAPPPHDANYEDHATFVRYANHVGGATILARLRELGFAKVQDDNFYYYHEAESWSVFLTWSKDTDDVEELLRNDGFPVERILRYKRLRALID